MYRGVREGKFVKSQTHDIEYVRFEEASGKDYLGLNFEQTMWYANSFSSLEELSDTELNTLNITNSFIVDIYNLIDTFISANQLRTGVFHLGLILNNGVNLVYPGSNATLWLDCSSPEEYDPQNTLNYKNRVNGGVDLRRECSFFTISFGFSYGVVVFYMQYSYFHQILLASLSSEAIKDLTLFIASVDLDEVIFLSASDSDYDKPLCTALYGNNYKLEQECEKSYEDSDFETKNVTFVGYNDVILGSYSLLNISAVVDDFSAKQVRKFIAGATKDQRLVLEGLNNIIEEALDIIFYQLGIFACFILISIISSWKLSKLISNRIFLPISTISRMLTGVATDEESQSLYNLEVNKVIGYIKLLNTFEKFIDPHFLLNPLPQTRIKNLTEAYNMFESLKNYRGMSVVQNLIGNSYFSIKNYEMAKESYSLSLSHTESLLEKLNKIEKTQEGLSSNEQGLLRKHTGRNKRSWNDQKMYLIENISERKQQLCMTLEAQFINYIEEDDIVGRKKLKEISKYQLEILEYYLSTRTHFFSMIKVLLNMAKIFEYLKYFHSGLQLLEIVKDELLKIKNGQSVEVDIDITRLRSIGISLKLDDTTTNSKHFIINDIKHEKDILMQEMFFRRGIILMKTQKVQEAGHSLTSAIVISNQEYGVYFDPKIRIEAVSELNKLFEENNLIKNAKDFQEIRSNLLSIENSLLFVLVYDAELDKKTNKSLIEYFKSGIDKIKNKTGVVLDNRFPNTGLELEQRDVPEFDIEEMFDLSKKQSFSINLYDALITSIFKFDEDSTMKVAICIVLEKPDTRGSAKYKNLYLFEEKNIHLIVIHSSSSLTDEFKEFIEEENITAICTDHYIDFESVLEILSDHLKSLTQSRKSSKKSQKFVGFKLSQSFTHINTEL